MLIGIPIWFTLGSFLSFEILVFLLIWTFSICLFEPTRILLNSSSSRILSSFLIVTSSSDSSFPGLSSSELLKSITLSLFLFFRTLPKFKLNSDLLAFFFASSCFTSFSLLIKSAILLLCSSRISSFFSLFLLLSFLLKSNGSGVKFLLSLLSLFSTTINNINYKN